MNKKLTKRRLIEKLEEVINWLYKDQSLITNLTSSVGALILLVVIKFAIIGFQQKVYSGYFEYMVVALLLSILILQTSFKASGWGKISLIFVVIAGVGLIVYDTTSLLPLAGKMISFFAAGHILFMITQLVNFKELNKFFLNKSLIRVKEIKTETKPINIKFKTNDGKNVSFKAVKVVKKKYKK